MSLFNGMTARKNTPPIVGTRIHFPIFADVYVSGFSFGPKRFNKFIQLIAWGNSGNVSIFLFSNTRI